MSSVPKSCPHPVLTPWEHGPGTRTARRQEQKNIRDYYAAVPTPGSTVRAQKFSCLRVSPRRKTPWLRT